MGTECLMSPVNFGKYLLEKNLPGLAADCLFPGFISIVNFLSSAKVLISWKTDETQSSLFISLYVFLSAYLFFPAALEDLS